ncbi:hypothetical protein F4824DRAFT_494063 [Ustulina deusta]|nr:hypothetical protein F4824DRAFT_494063 [Ustulina deusta]
MEGYCISSAAEYTAGNWQYGTDVMSCIIYSLAVLELRNDDNSSGSHATSLERFVWSLVLVFEEAWGGMDGWKGAFHLFSFVVMKAASKGLFLWAFLCVLESMFKMSNYDVDGDDEDTAAKDLGMVGGQMLCVE